MSFRDSLDRKDSAESAPLWERCLFDDSREVPEARRAAIEACKQAGASEEDCLALDLALGEALANAVVHGVPPATHGLDSLAVCLRIWRYRGRLIIEITDHGPGFEPPSPPYPMPVDFEATHGRGLPLMQMLTDAMLVSRGDAETGGVSTFLVKTLSRT